MTCQNTEVITCTSREQVLRIWTKNLHHGTPPLGEVGSTHYWALFCSNFVALGLPSKDYTMEIGDVKKCKTMLSVTDHTCRDIERVAAVSSGRRVVASDTGCRKFVGRWRRLVWRFSHTVQDTSRQLDHPRRGILRTASCYSDMNRPRLLQRHLREDIHGRRLNKNFVWWRIMFAISRDVFEDAMVKAKVRSFRIKATYAYEILHD